MLAQRRDPIKPRAAGFAAAAVLAAAAAPKALLLWRTPAFLFSAACFGEPLLHGLPARAGSFPTPAFPGWPLFEAIGMFHAGAAAPLLPVSFFAATLALLVLGGRLCGRWEAGAAAAAVYALTLPASIEPD